MKKQAALTIFMIIWFCTEALGAGAPVIKAFVDKKTIFIGDRVRYRIEIRSKEDMELELPKFEHDRIGDFEIKESGRSSKRHLFGNRVVRISYDIATYSVGKHLIPSIELRYKAKDKKESDILKTNAIMITVESILPKDKKLEDIKDIKGPLYFREINWALILGLLLLSAASIIGIARYVKARRGLRIRLPYEIALEELDSAKEVLSKTGDVKEYYVGVSDCVRRYIERTYFLKAPEMTTEEFLISLKDSRELSSDHKSLLKEFLASCDLVKFARYAPIKPEIEAVYIKAKDFINETKEASLTKENRE